MYFGVNAKNISPTYTVNMQHFYILEWLKIRVYAFFFSEHDGFLTIQLHSDNA